MIPKLRQRMQLSKLIENRQNSVIWDELKIKIEEIPKVINHGWDEIRIEAHKA